MSAARDDRMRPVRRRPPWRREPMRRSGWGRAVVVRTSRAGPLIGTESYAGITDVGLERPIGYVVTVT